MTTQLDDTLVLVSFQAAAMVCFFPSSLSGHFDLELELHFTRWLALPFHFYYYYYYYYYYYSREARREAPSVASY